MNKKNLIFGSLLIGLGLLLALINSLVLPGSFASVFWSWPNLLLIISLYCFTHRSNFVGLILLFIGVFYLIPRLAEAVPQYFTWVGDNYNSIFGPALLIVLGVLVMSKKFFKNKDGSVIDFSYSIKTEEIDSDEEDDE